MSDEIEVVVEPSSSVTDEKIQNLLNLIELDRQRRISTELKLAEAQTEIRVALACLSDAGDTEYTDLLQAADDLKKYRLRSESVPLTPKEFRAVSSLLSYLVDGTSEDLMGALLRWSGVIMTHQEVVALANKL